MSEVDRLLEAFESGSLVRPSSESLNIVDLSRAMAALAGVENVHPTAGSGLLIDIIGQSDHMVFILVDGLGVNIMGRLPGDSFLRNHHAADLRTVFPSTTAVALTSLATGEWPNRHAVTGWWTHLDEIKSAAVILQYVKRSDRRPLAGLGVEPGQVFPLPPLLKGVKRDTLALFPDQVCETSPSIYFSGHKPRCAYKSFREAIDVVIERVRQARGQTYTYLYTPLVDSAVHVYGTGRPEVLGVLNEIDREVARLHSELGGRARIALTADHGFLDAPQTARHRIRVSDSVMEHLRYPPSGDARVLYMHLREDAEEPVREFFSRQFGERFILITTDEAECLELFGPGKLSPLARSRMGDMIAISTGLDVIEYRSAGGAGRIITETSQHSGLTPQEMRVPLVIG
jgi:hypothetical protein